MDGNVKNKSAAIGNFVQIFMQALFHERTVILENHWDLYFKSGLLNWFGKSLKKKYKIPKLRYEDDFTIYNDYDDIYGFGSDFLVDKKQDSAFMDDIFKIMELLYLPENSYYTLFVYFLYKKKPEVYPIYNWADILAGVLHDDMAKWEYFGFTDSEIKNMLGLYKLFIADNTTPVEKNSKKELEEVPPRHLMYAEPLTYEEMEKRLKKYKVTHARRLQRIRNLDSNIDILKSLIKYGTTETWYGDEKIRLTSSVLSERVFAKSEEVPDYILSSRYRKQVQRLLQKYPFLKVYIGSN